MGLWDAIRGQSRPGRADLDSLFLVPSAAVTLQTTLGLVPTGDGSVCFRAASGRAFDQTQQEILELVRSASDAPQVRVSSDEFGYTWIEIDREPGADVEGLCTGLHAVNSSLEEQGFGAGLLCSLIAFDNPAGHPVGLVYLYKQGTFYPFAPSGERTRDNLLELQLRDALQGELPIEADLQRWMALWGAPGL
jgi:hypothetical protein